jgi:hypothetical protein
MTDIRIRRPTQKAHAKGRERTRFTMEVSIVAEFSCGRRRSHLDALAAGAPKRCSDWMRGLHHALPDSPRRPRPLKRSNSFAREVIGRKVIVGRFITKVNAIFLDPEKQQEQVPTGTTFRGGLRLCPSRLTLRRNHLQVQRRKKYSLIGWSSTRAGARQVIRNECSEQALPFKNVREHFFWCFVRTHSTKSAAAPRGRRLAS